MPSAMGFLALRLKRISGFVGLNSPVLSVADFICVGLVATNTLDVRHFDISKFLLFYEDCHFLLPV